MAGRFPGGTPARVTTALAIMLASVVALVALYLLVVGQQWTIVPEIPMGLPPSEAPRARTEFAPYPAAIIPLLSAVLLLSGIITHKLLIAWIGLVILIAFSVLFLFSSGVTFLPIAGLLLVLLITLTAYQLRDAG